MFTTVITPRVSETDGMGHINNTVVPIWFEAGRKGIFEIFTPTLSFDNWKCVVVNLNVDYINEIHYGQDVTIHTYIKEIRNSSYLIEEEMYQNNQLCSRGTATYVNFNKTTRKAEPIPEELRQQLEKHKKNNEGVGG
ncbi:thioesterase family protein [Lysinibacillus sp. FSL K6-0232]|uniref:acyl-CoA thioesterase n=1 Tax=unclassified Lysinibacillus TaxID=2636778 RepID=UPI0030F7AA0A